MEAGALPWPFRLFQGGSKPSGLRIALVSTPRSGNTWLRHMLDDVYRFSAHERGELPLYEPA